MRTTTIPQRDGRCFVETPAEVAQAIRDYLAADATWKSSLRRGARTSQFYDEMNEAERECCRVMVEHQGVHARMVGYYEVDGVWVGFDKVSRYGLTLVVRRTRPVFAAKGSR